MAGEVKLSVSDLQNIINEIVKRVVFTVNPDKIILFGSYAYGTPTEDSDVDLLVVKSGTESKIQLHTRIRKSLKGIKFPFDIIVMSPEEYEFYSLNWRNSIVAEAREKGSVLYGS